ncbi:Skb1 methyltransferase, partial [Martensiomyces pterosporus]
AGGNSSAWLLWNELRLLCNSDSRLQIALELDVGPDDGLDIAQWVAEPVQLVMLPTRMFTTNAAGFPVLAKRHQEIVRRWMQFNVAFVVSEQIGAAQPDQVGMGDYIRYVRHLGSSMPERDAASAASDEYHDVLQAPLQPLMDHLESVTYEVFEQDLPKYDMYEEAMVQAISDFAQVQQAEAASSELQRADGIVLVVAGAGRGPLVSRAISAAKRTGAQVALYALEKNPSAFVELQRKNATLWNKAVTLVHADMRQWTPTRKADILVSELLGSFGDNELSPECLDGAQGMLAEGGICIPQEYTSYIAPLSSSTLHNKAKAHSADYRLETPYVVNMHAVNVLAGPQPVWSFYHPDEDAEAGARVARRPNSHNQRASRHSFKVAAPSLVHGMAGYFDATLYGKVQLSIHPDTHTPNMHSWFPIYFPLKRPLTVMAGDEVVVSMWRRADASKAWYEWAVATPRDTSDIHNINGHEYWIG